MSPGQRTAPDNGIWLCQKCAKLIDSDTDRYTITRLREWKVQAEGAAQNEIEAVGAPHLMSGNENDDRSVTVGGNIVGSTVLSGDHNEINIDQRTIHFNLSRPEIVVAVAAGEDRRISNLQQRMTARRRFVGRKALLKKLRKALQRKRPTALTQTQAIHGLGGVGKTQLALEYARLHAREYFVLWWIRAEQPTTLLSDLAALAEPMGLPDDIVHAPDLFVPVAEVLRILNERDGWLLIYDNADSPADLEGYLPSGSGHVIITSRNRNWGQLAESLPLDVFNLTESRDLLLGRSGQSDRLAAEDVARRLGRLPLAMEVAGAYCQATGMMLSEYAVLLNRVGLELLDEHKPIDYHAVITATWRPSFENACEQSPLAGDVLALMSFLAPDDIPRALLAAPHDDPLQFNAALAALLRYSLIDSKKEILSIHRLVQEVFRDQLSDQDRSQWTETAVLLLDTAVPPNPHEDVTEWHVFELLSPHVLALAVHAERLSLDSLEGHLTTREDGVTHLSLTGALARMLGEMGSYLFTRAQFPAAESLMRRTLTILERAFGLSHPCVARCLNNLVVLLQQTSQLQEAESMARRALAIDEHAYGADDVNVARDNSNLAMVLKDANRLAETEPLMRRALAIYEKIYGVDHPSVANCLNNLATLLLDMNRLEEAETLMRRGLAIEEDSRGVDHPFVAIQLNNLAALLQDTNRLAEAEPLIRRALSINERVYGAEHPAISTNLNGLAHLLMDTQRLDEAEPLVRRALAIDEQFYGAHHPNVARDLDTLSRLLYDGKRLREAEPLMRRALAIVEEMLGPNHPCVADRIDILARLLQDTNQLVEAEQLMRRALDIDELAYGPMHPVVARDINNLAVLFRVTNRLSDAEPLMRRALTITELACGPDHPDVAIRQGNLAHLLHATRRTREAEPLMRRALETYRKFGEATSFEHPHMRELITEYTDMLQVMGLSESEVAAAIQGIWQ